MRIYDLIAKKRDGGTHTREELEAIVNGFVSGEVADYQMAAWMMAVYLRGMTNEETAELTDVMAHSGVMVDLSPIPGIKVDKHSTGGVGDKTTLVIAPIVAACGVKIAKMSGRGLGHTGGTIDKMESVPGTKTALSQEEFFAQVNRIGLSVIGQSEGIAVADKKMYALRDVTATVSCIPLIASSIMSKKLASGSDAILLDVTTGTGAFMKTVDQSIELAKLMVSIGTHHGRRVAAMITDMDTPLGHNIGNSLEVMESMDVLKGHGPADLTEVCLQLAANMLVLAGKGDAAHCRAMAEAVIADGSAFEKCKEMFAAQGGDIRVLDNYSLFAQPAASYELLAEQDGYITANDAEKIGSASVLLGAGRQKKGDPLDFAAGITLHKKRGDYVHKGESLATFYGSPFFWRPSSLWEGASGVKGRAYSYNNNFSAEDAQSVRGGYSKTICSKGLLHKSVWQSLFSAFGGFSALSVLRKFTARKGKSFGKRIKFAGTAKGSPFGRAAEQSEAERASPLKYTRQL